MTDDAVDGRAVRGEASRTKILDAFLDHLFEHERRPTVAQTAARAGVSERLIYHHFGDVDHMANSAGGRFLDDVLGRHVPVRTDGPLDARLSHFISSRCWLLEQFTPIRRAVEAGELLPVKPETRQSLLSAGRAEVRSVFAPELARLGDAEQKRTVDALDAATTWTTWEHLRSAGCDVAEAEAAVRALLEGVLAALAQQA